VKGDKWSQWCGAASFEKLHGFNFWFVLSFSFLISESSASKNLTNKDSTQCKQMMANNSQANRILFWGTSQNTQ
jgi:hypothetical protein